MDANEPMHSFKLQSVANSAGRHAGYLVIYVGKPGEPPSRYGYRLDIPESFPTRQALRDAANRLFARFSRSDVSAPVIQEKDKLNGYSITGCARFVPDELKWEPLLELKKTIEPNKGATQGVGGQGTPFPRNLFDTPQNAARFALDYGRKMVVRHVQGLAI